MISKEENNSYIQQKFCSVKVHRKALDHVIECFEFFSDVGLDFN